MNKFQGRCLILEDNPARYQYLINLMFEISFPIMKTLVITTTAKAAIEELERFKHWDIIMLDHDLDGKVYCNSENFNTGYTVAKFIVTNSNTFFYCFIHTLNDIAVPKMLDVLKLSDCKEGKVIYKPCVDL
jgi:CheY-like chemotaxis protein